MYKGVLHKFPKIKYKLISKVVLKTIDVNITKAMMEKFI